MKTIFHKASSNPIEVIDHLARRPDQKPQFRLYESGFEHYMDMLPILEPGDDTLDLKTILSGMVVKRLAQDVLERGAHWVNHLPDVGEFQRRILAIEDPKLDPMEEELAELFISDPFQTPSFESTTIRVVRQLAKTDLNRAIQKEGSELLVAQWGTGFTSPVHGHAPGLLHEEILFGEMRVNTYRWVRDGWVKPIRTDIATAGTLVSKYNPPDARGPRMGLIHNFTAATPAASLHYLAEHTRDGRDNKFSVENFHVGGPEVEQITPDQAFRLHPGEVVLVRSCNVPQYGDHFIVITGAPEVKDHGIRPADVAIYSPVHDILLSQYRPTTGVILLLLSEDSRKEFLAFHDIKVAAGRVTFPTA